MMGSHGIKLVLLALNLLSPMALAGQQDASIAVVNWLLQNDTGAETRWGTGLLAESARPETAWLQNFDGITPIDVPSTGIATIEEGLNACIADSYCVLRIDQLLLQDTVYLDRSKTRIVGKAGNRIRYADNQGQTGAFIEIGDNVHELLIDGLVLDGESTQYGNNNVFGLLVDGQGQNKIALLNNQIFNLFSNADAHGIAIYGTGSTSAMATQNVLIQGNQIHDLHTGSSETIAVNGNVSNWVVSGNRIERVNNIAIGLIGGEGTSSTRTVSGRVLPGPLDAARNGFVENNVIIDMSTEGNPAYGSVHSWAGAIYVDGAHHLNIHDNSVSNSEWAYDIGAENCIVAHDVLLQNNDAEGSYYGDLLLGGYASGGFKDDISIGCDPLNTVDNNEGHGYVENITVKANTLNTTAPVDDQGSPLLQYRIRRSIVIQPPVQAVHSDGVVSGDQNSIRIQE